MTGAKRLWGRDQNIPTEKESGKTQVALHTQAHSKAQCLPLLCLQDLADYTDGFTAQILLLT